MPGPFHTPRAALVLAALACACSRPDQADWPARNYSGVYRVVAEVDKNTCPTPVFAAGDTLTFTLLQTPQNEARVDIPPVVSVSGDFSGDRLEAGGAVSARPTGAAGEAAARETLDTAASAAAGDSIRYRIELDFEGETLKGTYRVEQPDLGGGLPACEQVFRVAGSTAASEDELEDTPG